MHAQIICILIACIVHLCISSTCGPTSGCSDGKKACDWLNWGGDCGSEWSSCTRSCGGGTRSRTRGMCCKHELTGHWDACLADCGEDDNDSSQSENCGDVCYNGGVIVPDSSEYYGRRCRCTVLSTGRCCSHRLCSWDNYYCWPGRCPNNEAWQCHCATGFHRQTGYSETTCQLDSTNTPSIQKCDTKVTGPYGEMEQAPHASTSTACSDLIDFYGNFQPRNLTYDLLTVFRVDVGSYTKPDFIHDSEFGITDILVRIQVEHITGATVFVNAHSIFTGKADASDVVMTKGDKCNTSLGNVHPQLTDGQWLCFVYEAYGGGFLRSIDLTQDQRSPSAPIPYQKTMATRRICYRYDSSPPEHCKLDNSCTYEPLQVSEVVTRKSLITVTFPGWMDPVPSGGNTSHASEIKSYKITVHEAFDQNGLVQCDMSAGHLIMGGPSFLSVTLDLSSDTPQLYAVYLGVKDVAGNVRKTRRFVLFDNSSHIDVRPDKAFFVESASPQTNYTWQTNHNDICLNWTDHFYNRFYLYYPLLNPVEPDPSGHIDGVYEKHTGLLPVSGTPNVYGIVEFRTSWSLNTSTSSIESKVPDFQRQHYCNNFNVTDGQTYTLNIQAVDIAGNSYAENRTVHIDRSAPQINNTWLVKDDVLTDFVQGGTYLSQMKLYFEAIDTHSGIREVEWTFGTSDNETVLLSGRIGTNRLDEGCPLDDQRDYKCYCPDIGKCEFYQYTLPMTNLATVGNDIGDLNKSYYFAIKATNQALLSYTDHIYFIINGSLSETQAMHEDPTSLAKMVGFAVGGVIFLVIVVLLIVRIVIMHNKRTYTFEQSRERNKEANRGRETSMNNYDDINMADLGSTNEAYSSVEQVPKVPRST